MHGDIDHFKQLTTGSAIIMGRKTLDSIGIALPNRKTIVITRGEPSSIPGVETAHSLDEAYSMADELGFNGDNEIFVVGGGQIYQQAIADVERIYATEVDTEISGADTYFPELDDSWEKTDEQQFSTDANNIYPYSFVTYNRK